MSLGNAKRTSNIEKRRELREQSAPEIEGVTESQATVATELTNAILQITQMVEKLVMMGKA